MYMQMLEEGRNKKKEKDKEQTGEPKSEQLKCWRKQDEEKLKQKPTFVPFVCCPLPKPKPKKANRKRSEAKQSRTKKSEASKRNTNEEPPLTPFLCNGVMQDAKEQNRKLFDQQRSEVLVLVTANDPLFQGKFGQYGGVDVVTPFSEDNRCCSWL